ncbi:L-aspartate oxidase [Pseudalkalibacillus salsuginis]|uniref:L-aspartate oxidase n=1 Tax=Pseudalkalibacillus salsuginis TaxID=2910972 RepID=UPI001F1FB8E8|nr:L-aspartate oxidase [Pseudalkalibacillus salsuginis]MCF6409956.1 L-aspartate oxidase [Pseudalkalibacillus salsuginis]
MKTRKTDVLIIGSGLSGLMTAELLSLQKNVMIFTKKRLEDSNSYLAQGGIAAAVQEKDAWYDHFLDTLQAGCFHNETAAARQLVTDGLEMIQKLVGLGVQFDRQPDGTYQYGKEGAHSHARILHIGGDSTGKHLIDTVKKRIIEKNLVVEGETVLKLIVKNNRCIGVWSMDELGEMTATYASAVILATGGLSGLYPLNSNASTITGDGLALAYDAGAELTDLEFIQFHPTLLVNDDGKSVGLVTEAIRGEGAALVDESGNRLMKNEHPLEDLAPRDVVSRVLYRAQMAGKETFLDIRNINDFQKRFPTVTRLCAKNRVSIEKGLIPVAPGAHFTMGGVGTDVGGRTSITGLYAVGEVANTGVHGANRLASNSLLEGVVFANRLAQTVRSETDVELTLEAEWEGIEVLADSPTFEEIREIMNNHIGIERDERGLNQAVRWFERYLNTTVIHEFPSLEDIKKRNQILVGWLVAGSALQRTESRGSHYRTDHPYQREKWQQRRVKRRKECYESVESTAGA